MVSAGAVSAGVVGRDEELAVVDAFLDDVRAGPRALVFVGEAGVGKTILWEVGARSRAGRTALRGASGLVLIVGEVETNRRSATVAVGRDQGLHAAVKMSRGCPPEARSRLLPDNPMDRRRGRATMA